MSDKDGRQRDSGPTYSPVQRRLHWLVTLLVLIQFLLQSPMRDAISAIEHSASLTAVQFLVTSIHSWGRYRNWIVGNLSMAIAKRAPDWRRRGWIIATDRPNCGFSPCADVPGFTANGGNRCTELLRRMACGSAMARAWKMGAASFGGSSYSGGIVAPSVAAR